MDLTVLGKSPSWQDAGGACSAYLIHEHDYSLLLDCGSGAFAKLRTTLDYREVDAVLISHLHADHVLDLLPFASALRYSPRRVKPAVAPALIVPEGGSAILRRLGAVFDAEDLFEGVFDISEYAPADELRLGPMSARFCEVPHFVRAFAVELCSPAGPRFTFGADCGPNHALEVFAADCDLLMLEATQVDAGPADAFRGHMTPAEAGALARRARAHRLVLTHFSDEVDPSFVRAAAVASFGDDVELASDGVRITI